MSPTMDLAATLLPASSMPVKVLDEGHEGREVRLALLCGRADETRNRERPRRGGGANVSAELRENPIALLVPVSIPARDGTVPAGLQPRSGEVQAEQDLDGVEVAVEGFGGRKATFRNRLHDFGEPIVQGA